MPKTTNRQPVARKSDAEPPSTPAAPTTQDGDNQSVEGSLLDLRRLFLLELTDQLKSKQCPGGVLAVIAKVLEGAGLLGGKITPPVPVLDPSTLPFKSPQQDEADTGEDDQEDTTTSGAALPFPSGRGGDGSTADKKPTTSTTDEQWKPLDRPFTVS